MGWVIGTEGVGSQGEAVGVYGRVGSRRFYWYRLVVIKRQQAMPSNAQGKTREHSQVPLCPMEFAGCKDGVYLLACCYVPVRLCHGWSQSLKHPPPMPADNINRDKHGVKSTSLLFFAASTQTWEQRCRAQRTTRVKLTADPLPGSTSEPRRTKMVD
jgi:hypothetical protein